jgi:geranylgeranyl pyrophosphate synthase
VTAVVEPARQLSPPDAVRAFAARHLPAIEDGLRQSLGALDPHLGRIRQATQAAVGIGCPGGSRWRPLLTLAAARAANVELADALEAAVAVELTHTASLVLDDLPCMDDSALRRGSPATHRLVGPSGAILIALGLLARATELLARAPHDAASLCAAWGRTVGLAGMSGGQAVDLAQAVAGPARGAARRLHRQKTTALAAFAVSAGARAGGAPAATTDALERFGRALGWAYQLADDAADTEEDRLIGRDTGRRDPRQAGTRLLRGAERMLAGSGGLTPAGLALLIAAGRMIVPATADEHELAC